MLNNVNDGRIFFWMALLARLFPSGMWSSGPHYWTQGLFLEKKGLVPGLPPQQHPTYTKQDLTDAINDVTLYNDGRIFFWMALARLALVPPLLPPG